MAFVIVTAPAVLEAQSAPSQTAAAIADATTSLPQVTVTARRRVENLEDVPIAISALSPVDLREDNITSTQDLSMFVPSMAINNNSSLGSSLMLRGQGNVIGANPGVIVYLADVPLINPQTGLGLVQGGLGTGRFFDLSSIDILKGPQGTLFGRNTMGGAMLITPQAPTDKAGGYAQLTLGEYNWRELEGAVNLPIIDHRLLVRLAGDVSVRDGYATDVGPLFPGRDYNNRHYGAVRLSIKFTSSRFENDLILDNYDQDQHGPGGKIVGVNPNSLAAGAFPEITAFIGEQQVLGPRRVSLSTYQIDRESRFAAINTSVWTLPGTLTLRNIAAYQNEKNTTGVSDFDDTKFVIQDLSIPTKWAGAGEQFSDELQLSGRLRTDRLQWIAGGYFEYARPTDTAQFHVAQPVQVLPGTYIPVEVIVQGANTQRSHAAYGQITYDLGDLLQQLDRLRFTAGFRYTWDDASASSNIFIPTFGNLCVETSGVAPNCLLSPSGRFSAPTWTFALDYQLTPQTLAYITSRRGYKSGGFNLLTPFHSLYSTYEPEYVTDVELGIKADWEIGRVKARTNVAVFHSDYTDIQRSILVEINGLSAPITQNAASATIDGVEWEQVLQPTASTELRLSYSYLQARYNHFFSPVQGDLSKLPFPYTPRNKVSVFARYQLPLSSQLGTVNASMTYAYQSSVHGQMSGPYEEIAGYGLLNLRLDWSRVLGSPLEVSIFVTNATNKTYVTRLSETYQAFGTAGVVYGEPRVVGGQIRYRIGP